MSEVLVPAGPADITPAWLADALSPRYPGVRVEAVDVAEVRQVTNTHAFLHVAYQEAHGAPEQMFCKMLPLDPERRTVLAAKPDGAEGSLLLHAAGPPPRPAGARRLRRPARSARRVVRAPDGGSRRGGLPCLRRHLGHHGRFGRHARSKTSPRCTCASRTRGGVGPRCRGLHWPRTFPLMAWCRSATASTITGIG